MCSPAPPTFLHIEHIQSWRERVNRNRHIQVELNFNLKRTIARRVQFYKKKFVFSGSESTVLTVAPRLVVSSNREGDVNGDVTVYMEMFRKEASLT